jgi:predicted nucleic acid-binding Zn ribbon protein
MERIEQEVRRTLRRFGAPGRMLELLELWPDAVGPEIARNAWPARLGRDGTLHVATSSSAWAFELSQLAPDVLARLRARLSESPPTALRFAPGPLPEPAPSEQEAASRPATTAGPEALAESAELVAGIGDGELRERVQKAVALSLQTSRSGRSV